MLLGVVIGAAGITLAFGDVGAPVEPGTALLLGGGVALYLAGNVAFRTALRIGPVLHRVGTAVAAMATLVLGVFVSAIAQLIGLAAILTAMLIWEPRRKVA
jgi:low temperature requirement protein LtrA